MKVTGILLVITTLSAFGYGYWDSSDVGGRAESMSAYSAAMGGASIPDYYSAFSLFTNPSALAGSEGFKLSVAGMGTTWREEIKYDYRVSDQQSRANYGILPPRPSIAMAIPLPAKFVLGAGFGFVAQYSTKANVRVYNEYAGTQLVHKRTIILDASGDLMEGLLSLSRNIGVVDVGISSGIRFGSGESTTIVNSINSGGDYSYDDSWESKELAFRAGANMNLGFSNLYTSYVNGSDRYLSYAGIGAVCSFPVLNGGFLGTELALYDNSILKMIAYTKYPGLFDNSNIFLGVSGYRPEIALKTGLGVSMGLEFNTNNYRIMGSYQYQTRYRDSGASEIQYINHIFDYGETLMIQIDRVF